MTGRKPQPPRRGEPPHPHAAACRAASVAARDASARAHRAAEMLGEWAGAEGGVAEYWAAIADSPEPASTSAAGRVCAATRAAKAMEMSMVQALYDEYRERSARANDLAARAAAAAGIKFDVDALGGRGWSA